MSVYLQFFESCLIMQYYRESALSIRVSHRFMGRKPHPVHYSIEVAVCKNLLLPQESFCWIQELVAFPFALLLLTYREREGSVFWWNLRGCVQPWNSQLLPCSSAAQLTAPMAGVSDGQVLGTRVASVCVRTQERVVGRMRSPTGILNKGFSRG